jgi:hypothetical protein
MHLSPSLVEYAFPKEVQEIAKARKDRLSSNIPIAKARKDLARVNSDHYTWLSSTYAHPLILCSMYEPAE